MNFPLLAISMVLVLIPVLEGFRRQSDVYISIPTILEPR